jgi:predicted SnoaL-like aldol condensation-catalyzing enzyme
MRKSEDLAHLFTEIIWRPREGVFTEHWDELNTLEVFRQMGAISPYGASA